MTCPTANTFLRTFMINTEIGQGTTFTLDVDAKRYLITAQHVTNDEAISLKVRTIDGWNEVNFNLVAKSGAVNDLVVLRPAVRLHEHEFPASVAGPNHRVSVGQDVLLLGFPNGLASEDVRYSDFPHPLPLLRKLNASGFSRGQWILDGFANPGISGGPVFFTLDEIRNLVGVVTSLRLEHSDTNRSGGPTDLSVNVNSGLVFATPIHSVMDLIRKTPNGLPLQ